MFVASVCTAADKIYGNVTVEAVVSVYDGDTFKADIQCWPAIVGKSIGIRIYGIDTPEIRGTTGKVKQLALEAKRTSSYYLFSADTVELRDMRRGKYFRIIADVYVDGDRLADLLIEVGLAKPYYGGKRPKW
jgi:endonuclease YncB( thermonuclease family)